jgi:hypothetical protein
MRTCVEWPARSVRSLRYHGTVLYLADSAPNFTANRSLVASQSVRDLLLCAKYLFVAARVSLDGQPSLLVGSRSGAERRWIEGARSTEPSSLVRCRYSACPVDSCRNVYSVGQPTMSPCSSVSCAAHHFVLGTSQEGLAMASTNKSLAQMSKT